MCNHTPEISIIIPVYNVEQYLPQCIESVINQTYQNFELLLIDDGSTDLSGIICDRYARNDPRLKVYHQRNQGASAARNLGIDQAQTEWICFIDSDDYVGENHISSFFDFGDLREDCLNMQGRKTISDIDDTILYSWDYPDLLVDSHNMRDVYMQYNFLSNSGPVEKLFNKKLLDRINLRFRTDLTVREDALFVYTYRAHISSIKLIPTSEYYYRQALRRSSLTHKNHPYETFLIVRRELPPIIRTVMEKWNIMDLPQAQKVLSYYKDRTCLSIIKSLYAYCIPRSSRLEALHEIFSDKAYFNDPYFHISKLLKLFRTTCRIVTVPVFDTLCYLPFRFYYKYLKSKITD